MNPMSFTGILKGGAQLLWLMTITNSNVMQGNYLVMSLSIKGLNPAAAPAHGMLVLDVQYLYDMN